MILKNCAYLITQNKKREILKHIDVLVEGDKILKIGKNLKGTPVLDCSTKIVMPGLINTHSHLGMHSLKGICDDKELNDWLAAIRTAEQKLTKKQVFDNTTSGAREALRFGTTTMFDTFGNYPEECVRTHKKSGMRIFFGSRTANEKFLHEKTALFTPAIATHSIYDATEKEIMTNSALAKEHGLLNRIHLAETRKERFDSKLTKNKLPLQYLYDIGFLDEKTVLIHTIWVTKGEMDLIAKTGAKVVHCPISNMKLASGGTMDLTELHKRGIVVGLGTDSVASNNNLDLFEEMKIVGLLQKYHRWDPTVAPVQKILDMATIDGARVLDMDGQIGSIEVGKKADIITLDIAEHMLPINDVISNIVYCANGNDVSDVIICLLYTSDAADDLLCVDLGGRRIIKKKKNSFML